MTSSRRRRQAWREILLGATALCAVAGPARAVDPTTLPAGGQVTAGQASIAQSGAQMTITQGTARAAIAWQGYSIGSAAGVTYVQPDARAIALNRVIGGDPSQILGRLNANGQVWLINPNGILFGRSARVDVAGLVAATADLGVSDQAFVGGIDTRFAFSRPGRPDAAVVNEGRITVREAGLAALVAPGVVNDGTIEARLGRVALGGGTSFVLDLYGDQLVNLQVGAPVDGGARDARGRAVAAGVANTGRIMADGGRIELRANVAQGVVDNVIRMPGALVARAASVDANGDIVLDGGDRGTVDVAGTIDAGGARAGERGGTVRVLGETVRLSGGARIDASGDAGGGTVLIGGNRRGAGPERNARAVRIERGARIDAGARAAGDGGTVVVWSDDWTRFAGTIAARGGALAGNGGFVETSSGGVLTADGTVDAAAPRGTAGAWLLDPRNVTIVAAASAGGAFDGGNPDTFTPSGDDALVSRDAIEAALDAGTSVTVRTAGGGGTQAGTITVAASITKSAGTAATLTLLADGDIVVDQAIAASGGAGALSVVLGTTGTVTLDAAIGPLNGGTLSGSAATALVGAGGLVQNGIDAVAAGGTVALAGSHAEGVVIGKALTLDGGGSAVLTAPAGAVVTVAASGVTVRGLVVTGTGGAVDGIVVDNGALRSTITVRDNDLHDLAGDGIRIGNGGTAAVIATLIQGNTIAAGGWAVNVAVPRTGLDAQAIAIAGNPGLGGGSGGVRIAGLTAGTVGVLDNGTITGGSDGLLVAAMTGGFVNAGRNARIAGTATGIRLDGVSGSEVNVFANTDVAGGTDGLAAAAVDASLVTINGNGAIGGGARGIALASFDATQLVVYGNGPITGTSDAGLAIAGFAGGSAVVGANAALQGGGDGLRLTGIDTSAVHVFANDAIGGGAAGARIDGVSDSLVSVNGNGPVTGGTDGLVVADTQAAFVVADGNDALTGLAGAGVRIAAVSGGAVAVVRNGTITGGTAGVAATGTSGSTLSLDGNGPIQGGVAGVSVADTTDSLVTANGNAALGGGVWGVQVRDSLDADVDVSGNASIGGGTAGVAFDGATGSYLTVTGNGQIIATGTGVAFAALDGSHAVAAGNAVTAGTGVAVTTVSGGMVDVLRNTVAAQRDGLAIDARGAAAGVTAVTIAGNAIAFAQGGGGGTGIAILADSPGTPAGVPDAGLAAFLQVAFGGGNGLTGTGAAAASPFLVPADAGFEVGLRFAGANSAIVGDTLGTMAFAAIAGNYVTLAGHALYSPGAPTLIDATSVSFDGRVVGTGPDTPERAALIAAIEARLTDFDDRTGAGGLANPTFVGQIFFVLSGPGAPPPAVAAGLADRIPVDGPFGFVAYPFIVNQPIGVAPQVAGTQPVGAAALGEIAPAAGGTATAGAPACAVARPEEVANGLLGAFALGDVTAFADATEACAELAQQPVGTAAVPRTGRSVVEVPR